MNSNVKAAFTEAIKELSEMSPEEFKKAMEKASEEFIDKHTILDIHSMEFLRET